MQVDPNYYSMPSSNPSPNPIPPPPKKNNTELITIIALIVIVILIGVVYFLMKKNIVPLASNSTAANLELNNVPTQTTGTPAPVTPPAAVTTSSPTITGLTLVNLQTFPVTYSARVSFDLVTTCATATSAIAQSGNTFTITVTSTSPIGAVCGDIVSPSEQTVSIPTSGLAAGTYKVVAGKYSKSFTISVANTPTYTSGK